MRRCRTVVVIASWISLCAGVDLALAQEPDHVGITMGFPTSVGVLCPLGAHLAIRPEFSFSHATEALTETALVGGALPAQSISNDANHVTAGVSVLVYVRRWDALRAYVTPRFSYSRSTGTTSSTLPLGLLDVTTHEYSVGGSFGAQYSPVRHFGVFGEIGLLYTSSRDAAIGITDRFRTISTVSSAGVILFF